MHAKLLYLFLTPVCCERVKLKSDSFLVHTNLASKVLLDPNLHFI